MNQHAQNAAEKIQDLYGDHNYERHHREQISAIILTHAITPATAELQAKVKELEAQLEVEQGRETCNACSRLVNPSLVESGTCIFCLLDVIKEQRDGLRIDLQMMASAKHIAEQQLLASESARKLERQSAFKEAAEVVSCWLEKNRQHPDIENDKLNPSASIAAHSALQQASMAILDHAAKEGK